MMTMVTLMLMISTTQMMMSNRDKVSHQGTVLEIPQVLLMRPLQRFERNNVSV